MPIVRRTAAGSMAGSYRSTPWYSDLPRAPGAGDDLVHAVEAAQEGRLAAAGGPDDGGDRVGLDIQAIRLGRRGAEPYQAFRLRDPSRPSQPAAAEFRRRAPAAACWHDRDRLPTRLSGDTTATAGPPYRSSSMSYACQAPSRPPAPGKVEAQNDRDQGNAAPTRGPAPRRMPNSARFGRSAGAAPASVRSVRVKKLLPSAVNMSGAVSPIARETPSSTPVKIPEGPSARSTDMMAASERVPAPARPPRWVGASAAATPRPTRDQREHDDGQRERSGEPREVALDTTTVV